jgi:hypothetical protein
MAIGKKAIDFLGANNTCLKKSLEQTKTLQEGIDFSTITQTSDTENIVIDWYFKQNAHQTKFSALEEILPKKEKSN